LAVAEAVVEELLVAHPTRAGRGDLAVVADNEITALKYHMVPAHLAKAITADKVVTQVVLCLVQAVAVEVENLQSELMRLIIMELSVAMEVQVLHHRSAVHL
jgi:hypothetical protein